MIQSLVNSYVDTVINIEDEDTRKIATDAVERFTSEMVLRLIERDIQFMSNLERSYIQLISSGVSDLIKDDLDQSNVIAAILGILMDPKIRVKVLLLMDKELNNNTTNK